jgi:hypothetical protein
MARDSAPLDRLPVPGVGRARWHIELIRCRADESAYFELEACDAQGRLGATWPTDWLRRKMGAAS